MLTQFATQVTQRERARFWVRQVTPGAPVIPPPQAMPFLTRPPADTPVLLRFVRDPAHLRWVHRVQRYNLRAGDRSGSVGVDSRQPAVEFVLLHALFRRELELWRVHGAPELWLRQRMLATGYARNPGTAYCCLPLAPVATGALAAPVTWQKAVDLDWRTRGALGSPVVVTWLELLR